jgi:hypothetical protein
MLRFSGKRRGIVLKSRDVYSCARSLYALTNNATVIAT